MSIPKGDCKNPERREHYVYRAYNSVGSLLYLGCSMDPEKRMKYHRNANSPWLSRSRKFVVAGPYNYDTARRLEKEGLATENPLFGWTPAKHGAGRKSKRRRVNTRTAYVPAGHVNMTYEARKQAIA